MTKEHLVLERAHARFSHLRPKDWVKDPKTGLQVPDMRWVDDAVHGRIPDPVCVEVLWEGEAYNVKTTAGIDFVFLQAYSTTPGANGLNYIGLSNDTLTETSASTVLSNEIAANGLTRAQGTYAHTAGAATATVARTFTASAGQSVRKAALFSALSGGTMNHALALPEGQRVLVATDLLAVTFTITLT
jgi:hypothetical protein